ERALTGDKYEIEVGGCKLLPVGVQRQLCTDIKARFRGENVELAVHERTTVVAQLESRVDQDSFHRSYSRGRELSPGFGQISHYSGVSWTGKMWRGGLGPGNRGGGGGAGPPPPPGQETPEASGPRACLHHPPHAAFP